MPITVNATSATFLMALAFVAGLTWLSRREAHPLWLIAIVAVPIGLLHLDTDWRLFSVHGLMHASMVYEIFERGLPAETPLVAGTPLQYPYGVHVLVAGILRVMPISPPTVFAMLNIGCLIGSIVVFDRIARAVSPDRAYRWLALILVMFGVTVFSGGPFGNLIFSSALEEHRWPLDILFKFITTNNNQLGILLYGIAMLGLIQLIKGCGNSIRNFATIGGGFVLAGLLYPFAWLAIGVAGGVTIIQLGVTHDSVKRRQALYVLGLFAVCTVLVLPWLLSLTGDKAPRGTMGLHPDQIAFAIGLLFIAMAGPLVLALWRRGEVTRLFQEHRETAIFFLGITAILQALFLVLQFPDFSIYKFLLFSEIPLAFVVAHLLRGLLGQSLVMASCLLFLIVLPFSSRIGPYLAIGWPVSDQATTVGRFYVHADPAKRALHQWILSKTPFDAVFLDTYLTLPVFARRSLFLGLDNRRDEGDLRMAGEPADRKDGWTFPARFLIGAVDAVDSQVVEYRRRITDEIFAVGAGDIEAETLDAMAAEVPGRALYILARDADLVARLKTSHRLREDFSNPAGTVFSVVGPDG